MVNQCNRSIAFVRRTVDQLAHILQTDRNTPEAQTAARAVMFATSQIEAPLRYWMGQLDEFAHKALSRKDTEAVNTIVTAMQTVGERYVDARRTSIVLVPDWENLFAGGRSDISSVLAPIHENLRVICKQAAKHENELVVRHCIRTLGAMTAYAMTVIHEPDAHWREAPLAFAPCYYLDLCVKIAIEANMPDAVFAAVDVLQDLLLKVSPDVDTSTVETKALETLSVIAAASYAAPNSAFGFLAVQALLRAAKNDIRVRGYRGQSVLKPVLRYVLILTPFEVLAEKAGQRIMTTFPPYNLAFEANLPAILETVAHAVEPLDPERSWVNPFAEFVEASEDIVHHYRDLAKVDFQDTRLRKWVVDSVLTCARVHIALLDNPRSGGEPFTDEVEGRLEWFIHALAFFFPEQGPATSHHADDAGDGLAILGMMLLARNRLDSTKACGTAIAAIAIGCLAAQVRPYAAANVLENLEILARAAEAFGHASAAAEFRALVIKPPAMADLEWATRMQEYATRVLQLDRQLKEIGRDYGIRDNPVDMLRHILGHREHQESASI